MTKKPDDNSKKGGPLSEKDREWGCKEKINKCGERGGKKGRMQSWRPEHVICVSGVEGKRKNKHKGKKGSEESYYGEVIAVKEKSKRKGHQ